MTKKYKNIIPKQRDTWKPEAGAKLEGKLVNKENGIGANDSMLYTIEQEDGEKVKIWGSTALNPLLEEIMIGTNIQIEFCGMEKNPATGRNFKSFKVGVEE